jgi:hypothetical protein
MGFSWDMGIGQRWAGLIGSKNGYGKAMVNLICFYGAIIKLERFGGGG